MLILRILALLFVAHISAAGSILRADVTAVSTTPCALEEALCDTLTLSPQRGTYESSEIHVTVNPEPFLGRGNHFAVGDRVLVEVQTVEDTPAFVVTDLVRSRPLTGLLLLFIACIVLLGGWAAARSLLAMLLSIALLLGVILPAMIAGFNPLLVAIGGGMVITLLTMLIGHGRHPKTYAALASVLLSLTLTCILALLFSQWAALSGLSDEYVLTLLREDILVDARGVLLAGIIIGTLGVLDDITITQASAVFELRAAAPALSAIELYRRALRIGSDHIAAGVNTLILAYAGTALPLLLIVASAPDAEGILTLINREIFATEIIRTLVGSIGLLAAVPLSTAIASVMAARMPAGRGGVHGGHRH